MLYYVLNKILINLFGFEEVLKMKKFISGVLTFAMLISVLPKVSFAEEEKAKSETVSKKEVAKTEKDSEKVEKKVEKQEVKIEKKVEEGAKKSEKVVPVKVKKEEKINKIRLTDGYKVIYVFRSITNNRELPDEVKALKPVDKTDVGNGEKIVLPKFADVKVADGTWKFVNWKTPKGNGLVVVENEVTVNGEDLRLEGEWIFEKNKPAPEKYNVTFEFKSVTDGKKLPQEVLDKKPANKSDVVAGTDIALPEFSDVKVTDGTWKFVGWQLAKKDKNFDMIGKVQVDNEDLRLVGKWKFEEDKNVKPQKPNPKPQQKPQQKPLKPLKPQKPKVKVQKGRMLPKTNVESAFSYVLLALAGIGGAYIAKKKDNE